MNKVIAYANAVLFQILCGLAVGGCIVALYCDQLVIALMCAAANSCLKAIWREVEWFVDYFSNPEDRA